jgi:hypothetical protein
LKEHSSARIQGQALRVLAIAHNLVFCPFAVLVLKVKEKRKNDLKGYLKIKCAKNI